MMRRKVDVAAEYKISFDRLDRYEQKGVLKKLNVGGFENYDDDATILVIAKAEKMGFSFDEIVMLIRNAKS